MYRDYFGLREYPFRLTPDLDYLFMSRGHARAKSCLDYAMVSDDGFVVITGEVGSGKTTLMHKLLSELPEQIRFVHIEHTQLTATEFLQAILQRLIGEVESDNKVELLHWLQTFVERAHAENIRLVIAVDEAQSLSFEVLEEIRMLASLAATKEKLISIVLMGQPELARMLDQPRMEQLRQRVRLRFHLEGMTAEETREYIEYRLRVAGAETPEAVFEPDTTGIVFEYTGGIPRLINTLCDMALLTAYVDERPRVDTEVVRTAVDELEWSPYADRRGQTMQTGLAGEGADGDDPPAPTSLIPASQLARLTEALEDIDRHLDRIAAALEQRDSNAWKRGAS